MTGTSRCRRRILKNLSSEVTDPVVGPSRDGSVNSCKETTYGGDFHGLVRIQECGMPRCRNMNHPAKLARVETRMESKSRDLTWDIRPLVRRLGKPPEQWQRSDLLELCLADGIQVVNFRYTSFDGKLRELRLPVNNRAYLERILAGGERVDGSSLFPGLFPTGESDLYAVPVYRWAFLNPFADDELDIVCRFVDHRGRPCVSTPDNVVVLQTK